RAEDDGGERLLGVCRAEVQEGCTGAGDVNARHGALDRDGLPHVRGGLRIADDALLARRLADDGEQAGKDSQKHGSNFHASNLRLFLGLSRSRLLKSFVLRLYLS